ncbi:MAG TPA: hypothetical protein VK448_08560 [Dissulfurispiraceae bacterium]|nr:hypothetical protein [Dissulfurispiraceae bacterium]
MKKILAVFVVVAFTLAVAGLSLAAEKGTITKIEGSKVTVKTADGKETTATGDAGLKVGDKVTVNDGKVIKKKAIEGC